jgi:diketogulonate reductase-like aldo/keto reductase
LRCEKLFDGTEIPVIGLGTYTLGGGLSPDHTRDREHIRIIQRAIETGYRHLDTAQMYGGGHTEELVGEAISAFDREELFITTKVMSDNLSHGRVLQALEGSLKKLKTGYVDFFLIHWPSPVIPLEETFRAFNELVESGKIRYAGVSNFNVSQLREAQELSNTPIAVNQVEYNVGVRKPEKNGVLEYCRAQGILLTAYEPLGKGLLIRNPVLRTVAEKHGVSTARVAIAWLLREPGIVTIPMTADEEHLKDNFTAWELELTGEDLELLNGLDG